jgi:GntR family transcriptional regulator
MSMYIRQMAANKNDAPMISVDLGSMVPVYRQIIDAIRPLLLDGHFEPGDVLPTSRELGVELGVHHNTVAEAYRQLADEGWLELKRRVGAVVLPRTMPRANAAVDMAMFSRFEQWVAEALSLGMARGVVAKRLRAALNKLEEE